MSEEKSTKGWSEISRYSEEQSVGEILQRIVSRGVIADKLLQLEVRELYPKIIGKNISVMTENVFVRKGKLYIKVESAALKQELVYARGKIMELINEKLTKGRIVDVVIL